MIRGTATVLTGLAFTADARVSGDAANIEAWVSLDGAPFVTLEQNRPTEDLPGSGAYHWDLQAFETDAYRLEFLLISTTEGVQVLATPDTVIYTTVRQTAIPPDTGPNEVPNYSDPVIIVRGDDYSEDRTIKFRNPGNWPEILEDQDPVKVGLVGTGGDYEYETALYNLDLDSVEWSLTKEETAVLRGTYAVDVQVTTTQGVATLVGTWAVIKETTTDRPPNLPLGPGSLG
jgi:hypothetical protein